MRRFDAVIARSVARAARKWGGAPLEVLEDLVQQVYMKLCADQCRVLREFKPKHPNSIYRFLQVVATNTAYDYFGSQSSQRHGGESTHVSLDAPMSPQASSPQDSPEVLERSIYVRQIYALVEKMLSGPNKDRDLMVFSYYFRHGMSARAISTLSDLGLTSAGVESLILRIIRRIRDELGGAEPQT